MNEKIAVLICGKTKIKSNQWEELLSGPEWSVQFHSNFADLALVSCQEGRNVAIVDLDEEKELPCLECPTLFLYGESTHFGRLAHSKAERFDLTYHALDPDVLKFRLLRLVGMGNDAESGGNSWMIWTKLLDRRKKNTTKLEATSGGFQRLLSQVAHDLKAPLYSFAAVGQRIVEKDAVMHPQHRSLLKSAVDGILGLSDQVDRMLDKERFQNGRLHLRYKEIDLHQLVEELMRPLRPYAALRGINLRNQISPGNTVHTDREVTLTILSNLVQNAIQACEMGDWVTVGSDADYGVILVEDSGPGLKRHQWNQLLSGQAKSNNPNGHGLGICFCLELLKMLGGHIELVEDIRIGTTFRVHLVPQSECPQLWVNSNLLPTVVPMSTQAALSI